MRRWFFLVSLLLLTSLAGCALRSEPVSPAPAAGETPMTGITGTVTDRTGAPATGAYVYAYRSPRGGLRGPADFEAAVGADGRYLLDLAEGSYHLVARRRPDGGDAGPPRSGDAWALPAKNPVTVMPGRLATVDFALHMVAQPMLMREGTLTSGDTGFTGTLVDAAGHPLSGAFVIAYPDGDLKRMPEATSPAVGEDGHFTLYVNRPGRWCLAARTRTRGQPVAGELYGVLGEGAAGCREVSAGQMAEVGSIRLSPYRR
ncbi:MAG: carboxypeptidase-like regulatory domain-containing protein [Desulfuromonadales bacterium]|nr:carboxypeptidase-like regulatory domain-containing protein [Desulfuromonadales bacterium]